MNFMKKMKFRYTVSLSSVTRYSCAGLLPPPDFSKTKLRSQRAGGSATGIRWCRAEVILEVTETNGLRRGGHFLIFFKKRGEMRGVRESPPTPLRGVGGQSKRGGAGKREKTKLLRKNHRRAILGRSHFSANTSGHWLFQRLSPVTAAP